MSAYVIDFAAERLAREEEARTAQAIDYLTLAAAQAGLTLMPLKTADEALQMVMDLMPAELPVELTEAHILKLERNRT